LNGVKKGKIRSHSWFRRRGNNHSQGNFSCSFFFLLLGFVVL